MSSWKLQKVSRAKGLYFQAVWGTPPRRRVVTLGYLSPEEAGDRLLSLKVNGAFLANVFLPDGSQVALDDPRACEGAREVFEDDAIRLASTLGHLPEKSLDAFLSEQASKAALASGDYASLPLRDFHAQVFWPVRIQEVASGTARREGALWKLILDILGDVYVRNLDGLKIERFLLSKSTWGGAARRLAMNALRCLLKYAVDLGILKDLPRLRPVKGSTKRSLPRPVALLPEEVAKILANASTPAHKALFATAIGQGLRPAEASSISWEDVDFLKGTLHVRGTKTELSDRVIPLTPATSNHLKPFWESLGRPQNGRAFTYRGKPIHEWKGSFSRAAERAGLTLRAYPYLCRHTFATSCALSGVPQSVAKEMLGHSEKSEMLEKAYQNPHSDQIAEAMQRLTRLGG